MKGVAIALLALSSMLASRRAGAQEPLPPPGVSAPGATEATQPTEPVEPDAPLFGGAGQWVILSTSSSAGISSESFSASQANFFDVEVAVGVDRFIVRNVSIGIDAEVGYADFKGYGATGLTETTSNHFAGGVRLGVNVPFGRLLSFYPRVTVGAESKQSDTVPASTFSSHVGAWVNLYT
ncbi:MAG: hypothetical protein ACRENE_21535, partial [Polyangiaceae bacterium]